MRYIDKNTSNADGNRITDEYLDSECKMTDPLSGSVQYLNIAYSDSFTSKGYRGKMLGLAMTSQKKYCCYCLRKIGNGKQATLEHIIPQDASSTAGYDKYDELSEEKIVLTKDYTSAQSQGRPPYPHTVAWNNLVVSCKGQFPLDNSVSSHCCNNARGSSYAPPVYYLNDIESRISIMHDGSIHAKMGDWHDDIDSTIVSAKLNCMALKEIRKLWYLLRNVPYRDIVSCIYDRNKRMVILISAFKEVDDFHPIFKYLKDDYWMVFMKYNLFYVIYREKE